MAILLVLYAFVLAAATFVESGSSSEVARRYFYNNLFFFVLNGLLILSFVAMSLRLRLRQQHKWGALILHYGFVVVLLGAMTTYLFGQEGVVHIREGASSNVLLDDKGGVIGELPFEITLDDFVLERYSGSMSPSSFESFLTIEGEQYHAYMNNVVYYGAYRIYQSSYDSDLGGSILSVNRDFVGTMITYIGYLMLLLGFLIIPMQRNSRFRALIRSLSVLTLFWVSLGDVVAQESELDDLMDQYSSSSTVDRGAYTAQALKYIQLYSVPDSIATKFSTLRIQSHKGRIEPIDTYARELLRKFNGRTSVEGLNPSQALLGWISQPQIWSYVPFLSVSSETLLKQLGFDPSLSSLSFMDLIDDLGGYRLDSLVERSYSLSPSERNKYDKELLKLDEKINILNALFQGDMLPIFPIASDPTGHWYSWVDEGFAREVSSTGDSTALHLMPILLAQINNAHMDGNWQPVSKVLDIINLYQVRRGDGSAYSQGRISMELLYNKMQIFKWNGYGFMTLGLLLIIVTIVSLVRGRAYRGWFIALTVLTVLLFLAQNFGMGLRWYISQRAPWTNAYETMIYVGWAAMLCGLLFARSSRMTFALATFLAGVIMFVTNLSWMDPQITPLVPVLKSYWLVIHVGVITASYGFFGIAFLLGFTTLLLMAIGSSRLTREIRELVTINEIALWIGLSLMTLGTFIGAIWANESWGRYWGWDPKETWALITVIVYTFVLHARMLRGFRGSFAFSLMSILALGSVLMTFFGVNYYLSGMHSYGGDSAPPALSAIWVVYGVVALVTFLAYRKRDRLE
ncbi:MAG: cytochrome c biogenesis protein CcsA [Rikenellaceae bacterium]